MSALSRFLAKDALAAAFVATLLASPALAAPKGSAKGTALASAVMPPVRPAEFSGPSPAERAALLARTHRDLSRARDILSEGTRVCHKDMRWFLLKVGDETLGPHEPSSRYLAATVERYGRAVEVRKREISATPSSVLPAMADDDVPRSSTFASPEDVNRLRSTVERLRGLRTSCLAWAERAVETVAGAASGKVPDLARLRTARDKAERDYRRMQTVDVDAAVDALRDMELGGPEPAAPTG